MNCEDTVVLLGRSTRHPDEAEQRRIDDHLASCEDCRLAERALRALQAEKAAPDPVPRRGAFARAMETVLAAESARSRFIGGFWGGLAVGAAAAAAVVAWAFTAVVAPVGTGMPESPGVSLALNEPRHVRIAIDSPEFLDDAEIHVTLRGAIDVQGFEGQRDIRWTTDLERGINELKLPVIAIGMSGGQLVVEVEHQKRRKRFLVDVHASAGRDAA